MFLEADLRRGAYDPETLSMLSTVLERVVAALPHGDRTDERKARLASSILGQPPGASETLFAFTRWH